VTQMNGKNPQPNPRPPPGEPQKENPGNNPKVINIGKRGRVYIITEQLISGKHEEFNVRTHKVPVDSIIIIKLSWGYLLIDYGENHDSVIVTEDIYEINDYMKDIYGIEVVDNE